MQSDILGIGGRLQGAETSRIGETRTLQWTNQMGKFWLVSEHASRLGTEIVVNTALLAHAASFRSCPIHLRRSTANGIPP